MEEKMICVVGGKTADGEMSLEEKKICLMLAKKRPELPYPLKDVKCADGTVQKVYEIPDTDKAKVSTTSGSSSLPRASTTRCSTSTRGRASRCGTSSSSAGAEETSSPAHTSRTRAAWRWTSWSPLPMTETSGRSS